MDAGWADRRSIVNVSQPREWHWGCNYQGDCSTLAGSNGLLEERLIRRLLEAESQLSAVVSVSLR